MAELAAAESEALAGSLFQRVRERLVAQRRFPLATYRVQLNKDFTFEQARALVPYLSSLGVSDLYAAPYLKAAPGSLHGYDCVDHGSLNPEIGSETEHEALCAALAREGLGQVLDFVPNHMGIDAANWRWLDVLENGPSSLYARTFDIDWDPVKEELRDRVLLPILGDQYGAVLEKGELKLRFDGGAFFIDYYDRALPVAPRAYADVLKRCLPAVEQRLGASDLDFVELQSVLTAIEHLPHRTETEEARRVERNREKEVIKRRLRQLTERAPAVKEAIHASVEELNGRVGEPRSFDGLDALLGRCSYRLAHWRVAGEEINYRRFFDINGLAAIRVEDEAVFEDVHALLFRWISQGKLTGLRIDHPDGLFDPTAYFQRLQLRYFLSHAERTYLEDGQDPARWKEVSEALRARFEAELEADPQSPLRRLFYVVVEKIQGGRERIPESWAVMGTTGYRFANSLTGLFVDGRAERAFTETYEAFLGRPVDFRELVYEKKKLIMRVSMASEMNVLARELNRVSEMNRRTRDFTHNSLRRALTEFVALFPVYRTYVDGWRPGLDERDVRYVEWTIARAKQQDATTNASIYDFLQNILLRRYPEPADEQERATMLRFAMKLQQLTGPVMAKGLEDTVFYLYNRFVALNEVGGEPERFGTSVATFHLRNQERAEKWPGALLASSTHDTKRGEDVRARLAVLSELPQVWREHVQRWGELNRRFRRRAGHHSIAPDANDEYLLYQTLLGAWPAGESLSAAEFDAFRGRLREYMLKAIREAKLHTSWTNPDAAYEGAVAEFCDKVLSADNRAFLDDAAALKRRLERPGQVNSLAQVVLKVASPGTPDFYQGAELWELSLVDPDNRRPVDFALRARLLQSLTARAEQDREALCRALFQDMTDGSAKLYTVTQGLRLRRRHPELLREGRYLPLDCTGEKRERALAFARLPEDGGQGVVAVVPRLVTPLLEQGGPFGAAWGDAALVLPDALEGRALTDVFTGRTYRPRRRAGVLGLLLGELFDAFPVALLETVG